MGMISDRPTFAPPIYNPVVGGSVMSPPRNPFRKSASVLRAGIAGLGMTVDEAKNILMNSGAYDAATVAQANQLYYGSTQSGSYQASVTQASQPSAASCGSYPSQPSVVLMSTPQCGPSDSQCISTAALIQQYNLALAQRAEAYWQRAVCERNNCLNAGTPGYPRDCASLFPDVYVPPQPSSPQSVAVYQTGGVATGYAPTGTGYGTVTGGYVAPAVVKPTNVVMEDKPAVTTTAPNQTKPPNAQPGEIVTSNQTSTAQDLNKQLASGFDAIYEATGLGAPTVMLIGAGLLVFMLMNKK